MKLKVGVMASGVMLEAVPFEVVRRTMAIIMAQGSCFQKRRPAMIDRHILGGMRHAYTYGAMFDLGIFEADDRDLHDKAEAAWATHTMIHPYPAWVMVIRPRDSKGKTPTYLFAINCDPDGLVHFAPEAAKLNKVFSLGLWVVSSRATTFVASAEIAWHPLHGTRPEVHAVVHEGDGKLMGRAAVLAGMGVLLQGMYLLSHRDVVHQRVGLASPRSHGTQGTQRSYVQVNTEPYVTRLAMGPVSPSHSKADPEGATRNSPHAHERRGHPRTLKSGKVIEIPPAKVGKGIPQRHHYEGHPVP